MKLSLDKYNAIMEEYTNGVDCQEDYPDNISFYNLDRHDVGMIFYTKNARKAIYCGAVLVTFLFYDIEKEGQQHVCVDLLSGNFFNYCTDTGFYGESFDRSLFDMYSHGYNREGIYIDDYLK